MYITLHFYGSRTLEHTLEIIHFYRIFFQTFCSAFGWTTMIYTKEFCLFLDTDLLLYRILFLICQLAGEII